MEFQLSDSIKSYSKGQDKVISPQETMQNAMSALGKLETPLLKKARRIDYVDRLKIPVFTCEVDEGTTKAYNVLKNSYGKGVDSILSKASALMELIERFSCVSFLRDEKNFQINSYSNIKKERTQSEDSIFPLPRIYSQDSILSSELKRVPLKWFRSFSLTENRSILFPAEWFAEFHGSNGLAAGNSTEEAILQGLCEVIERHVISTITQEELATPTIDIDSIDNHIAKAIIFKFNKAGIKLYIKDFSLRLGVPTVGILAYDPNPSFKKVRIYCAAGTSLNRDAALIRALIELAQHRSQTLFLSLKARQIKPHTSCFPYYRNLKEAEYLIDDREIMKLSDLPTYRDKNFKKEIEVTVKELEDNGFEVIVTNATHSVLNIPAVIVTIPGSRCAEIKADPYLILSKYYKNAENYRKSVKMIERYSNVDPFVLYTFDSKADARNALLSLSYIRLREDNGNPISTDTLTFAYYPVDEGKYEALVSGEDLTYEMWKEAKNSFMKHGGHRNGALEPQKNM